MKSCCMPGLLTLLKKGSPVKEPVRLKCIDLTYLSKRTKANSELMKEMIKLYLDQTPDLIDIMKRSLAIKDWDSIHGAAHKMIPSFSIMGIHQEFENLAKMVQEYSSTQKHLNELPELILQLEKISVSGLPGTD